MISGSITISRIVCKYSSSIYMMGLGFVVLMYKLEKVVFEFGISSTSIIFPETNVNKKW